MKLSKIQIISPEEKEQILFHFNDTHKEYPVDKTIRQLFAEQVQKTPHSIAVTAGASGPVSLGIALTYAEFNRRANRMAHLLNQKGVGPRSVAGIIMPRSEALVISVYGILKTGAAYLPIDPDYSEERIQYLLADSAVDVLIVDAKNQTS